MQSTWQQQIRISHSTISTCLPLQMMLVETIFLTTTRDCYVMCLSLSFSHLQKRPLNLGQTSFHSGVMVKYLQSFAIFRNAIIYHIPHEYSDQVKECSKEVSKPKLLGIFIFEYDMDFNVGLLFSSIVGFHIIFFNCISDLFRYHWEHYPKMKTSMRIW